MNINTKLSQDESVRAGRGRFGKWVMGVGVVVLIIAVMPFVIALVYRFVPPPVSNLMVVRLLEGHKKDYRWQPIEKISPHLVRVVMTSEDARFCRHNGVDWQVMDKLIDKALDGNSKTVRGGSTITMQTAKNLFLWPGRSYLRKGLELPLAYWIDFVWPKRRIMEVYLNIAEWGPGIYGAEAAARYHFKKPARRLNRREASLLAASLPNPHVRRAGKPGRKTRRIARRINKRVRATLGFMSCLRDVVKR